MIINESDAADIQADI